MPATKAKNSSTQRGAARPSVAFKSFEPSDDVPDDIQNDDDDGSGDNEDESNVAEMMKVLEEYKIRKASKTSTRSAAFLNKKKALFEDARQNAEAIVRDGVAQLEACKARLAELRLQEVAQDKYLNNILQLWKTQDEAMRSIFGIYSPLIEDLSHRRADQINDASAMLEAHSAELQESRRKLIKNAKARMDDNLQNQKLATDATELIKHYKALLLA